MEDTNPSTRIEMHDDAGNLLGGGKFVIRYVRKYDLDKVRETLDEMFPRRSGELMDEATALNQTLQFRSHFENADEAARFLKSLEEKRVSVKKDDLFDEALAQSLQTRVGDVALKGKIKAPEIVKGLPPRP